MLDLNMLKPVLRAYALGYASSTIPRLLGLLRTLRRQDRTIQEKLDLVSPASALLFMQLQLPIISSCKATSQASDDILGKEKVFRISACLLRSTRPHVHQAHALIALSYPQNVHPSQPLPSFMRDHRRRHDSPSSSHTRYPHRSCSTHRQQCLLPTIYAGNYSAPLHLHLHLSMVCLQST
jgi:hypothetical protein